MKKLIKPTLIASLCIILIFLIGAVNTLKNKLEMYNHFFEEKIFNFQNKIDIQEIRTDFLYRYLNQEIEDYCEFNGDV